MRMTTSIATLLAATLFLPTSTSAQALPAPGELLELTNWGLYTYDIPAVDPPATLQLVVKGGQGGGAQTKSCYSRGGYGARIAGTFSIGFGAGELEPGGTLRVIVGEEGEYAHAKGNSIGQEYQSFAGGGGGSGVLYQPPGSATWIPLVVAGGGGGAFQECGIFGKCKTGYQGVNASLDEDGLPGIDGAFPAGDGGTGGTGGEWAFNGSSSGAAGGGGGLFGDGELSQDCGGYAGLPSGGNGGSANRTTTGVVLATDGGFGAGGGGGGGWKGGGGGGGGYSGGGAGGPGYDAFFGGSDTGSGGGGGSYVSPWASVVSKSIPRTGDEGFTRKGYAQLVTYDLVGNTCAEAFEIPVLRHDETYSMDHSTQGYTGSPFAQGNPACSAPAGTPDRWYRYTNTGGCDQLLSVSGTTHGVGGAVTEHVAILSDCPVDASMITCGSLNGAPPESVAVGPGETLWLRVYGATNQEHDYTLDVHIESLDLTDADGDGVLDCEDNCPFPNPDQADEDGDGVGDTCDLCPGSDDGEDSDGDGVPDCRDVCAGDDTQDSDGDGVPDDCDIALGDDFLDADGDGVPDAIDMCFGPEGEDCDGNGVSDACDLTSQLTRFEPFAGTTAQDWSVQSDQEWEWGQAGAVVLTDGQEDQVTTLNFEPLSAAPLQGFHAEFWFRETAVAGSGGNGISFSVFDADLYASDAIHGTAGPGAGALTISFDSFQHGGDPNDNHVDLRYDDVPIGQVTAPFDIDDGVWRKAIVSYHQASGLFLIVEELSGVTWPIFAQVDVPGYVPVVSRYGFGTRSTDSTSETRIDQVLFVDLSPGAVGDADGDGALDACVGQWIDQGGALAGSVGVPQLTGVGTLVGGDLITLRVKQAPDQTPFYLILGLGLLNAPFKGGVFVPTPDVLIPGLQTGFHGTWIGIFLFPVGVPTGTQLHWQAWIPDAGGPFGFSATNGLTSVAF